MEKKIKLISGGQTGVDRAALDIGLKFNLVIGGWCPEGRMAEDGSIPSFYPLTELPSGDYNARTRKNVLDSDGTLIIFFDSLAGGTELTYHFCLEFEKPYLLINAEREAVPQAAETLKTFIQNQNISTLNVAGPRASEAENGYRYTIRVLSHLLEDTR